jgi:trehalose 6-phosphate phosphatase
VPLPEPTSAAGSSGLTAVLAEPARAVVALDYDGTIAPIVARPEDARPARGALAALRVLGTRIGACALVTGRPAQEAARLLELEPDDRVLVLGHYGLQRWQGGRLLSPPPVPGVGTARYRLRRMLDEATEPPQVGSRLEDKEHSVALHTREAADPAGALETWREPLRALATETGLELVPGRFVLELRPPGTDKGGALRTLAGERDAHSVVYVGDDLGDLPAFDTVEELRRLGIPGLCVAAVDGSREGAGELRERADLVLFGPVGVVWFLQELAANIGNAV